MSNATATRHQPSRLALREWMRGRVTTQKMSEDLGFTPVYISYIRTGKRQISDSFKWKFTTRYGTEAAQQVFGDLPDSPQPDAMHTN